MNRLFRILARGWSWGGVALADSFLVDSGWSWGGVTK